MSETSSAITAVPRKNRWWQHAVAVVLMAVPLAGQYMIYRHIYIGGSEYGGLILAAAGAVLAGLWERWFRPPEAHSGAPLLNERLVFFLLIAILILGAMVRLHRLGDIEGRLCYSGDSTIDEAYKGQWAMEFLKGRPYTPFIQHWGERETLYIYLESAAIFFFGRSMLTLRAVSVGFGFLALVLGFFLARRLFGNYTALTTTMFLAGSAWLAATNRISERFNMVPAMTCLTLWLLARALATDRWWNYLLAGGGTALGMYSFPSYRVVPAVAALAILDDWLTRPGKRLKRLLLILIFAAAAAVVLLAPLKFQPREVSAHFLTAEQHSFKLYRHAEDLLENVRKLVLAFNFWFKNDMAFMADGPMVQHIPAALFLLGLGVALTRPEQRRFRFLLLWTLLTVAPAVVSEPVPRRLGATLPAVYLLAGLALVLLCRHVAGVFGGGKLGRGVGVLLATGAVIVAFADDTHRLLIKSYNAYYHPDCAEFRRAKFLEEMGKYMTVYLTHAGEYHEMLKYLTYYDPHVRNDWETQMINPAENLPVHFPASRTVLYSMSNQPVFVRTLPLFQEIYPHAQPVEHKNVDGQTMFYSVLVSPEDVNSRIGLLGLGWPGWTMERATAEADGALAVDAGDGFGPAWYIGSIYSPATERHQFMLRSEMPLTLLIDGAPYFTLPGSGETIHQSIFLPRGLHRVSLGVLRTPGKKARIWLRPVGRVSQPFPPCYFHTIAPGSSELTAVPVAPADMLYDVQAERMWASPFTDAQLRVDAVEIATNGDVVIGDFEHVRIVRYRADGTMVSHWNPMNTAEPPAQSPTPTGAERNRPFSMTAGHDNTIIASIDGRTELNWFSEDGRVIRTFGRAPEYMLDMVELPDGQIVCISGNVSRWRPGDEHFMPMFPDIEEMRRVIPTPGALAYDPGRRQFFVYDLVYEALLIFDEDWKPAGRIPNIGPHDRPRMAVLPGSRLVFSALRISAPLVFNEANELLVDAADPASRGLFGSDNYALLNDMATGPDGGMHLVTFEGRLISYSRRPLTDEAKRKFEQEQQQRIDG